MGLIDEVELVKALHKAGTVKGQPHFLCRTVYECINKAPKIDAVPVVRCKDCKHCNTDWAMGKWYGSCKIWNTHSVMADWYCVNGERKDDECMERNDDARRSNEYE